LAKADHCNAFPGVFRNVHVLISSIDVGLGSIIRPQERNANRRTGECDLSIYWDRFKNALHRFLKMGLQIASKFPIYVEHYDKFVATDPRNEIRRPKILP
jgi:hypothetical protein